VRPDRLARIGKVIGMIALPIAVVCWIVLLAARWAGEGSPTYGSLLLLGGLPLALCTYAGIVGAILCGLSLMRRSGNDALWGLAASLLVFALGVLSVFLR